MKVFSRGRWTIQYSESGEARKGTLILLHGFPGGHQTWHNVATTMAEHGYRVLIPSQRGYSAGAQPNRRGDYRLSELIDDVRALMSEVKVDRSHIVGHDWGGVVAWGFAAKYPESVLSLTVVSAPHPRAFLKSLLVSRQLYLSRYMLLFQLPKLPEWWLLSNDGRVLRASLKDSGLADQVVTNYTKAFMQDRGRLTYALNWYRAIPYDLRDLMNVGQIATPTLFVYGEKDKFVSQIGARLTSGWVQGVYSQIFLPNDTHWIPEQSGEELCRSMLDFVEHKVPAFRS